VIFDPVACNKWFRINTYGARPYVLILNGVTLSSTDSFTRVDSKRLRSNILVDWKGRNRRSAQNYLKASITQRRKVKEELK